MFHNLIKWLVVLWGAVASLTVYAISPVGSDENYMPDQGSPYYMSFGFVGESVSNLDGGLKTGTKFDALMTGVFSLNTSVFGLPEGGRIRVSAISVDGGAPSSSLIGDRQVASNIEANQDTLLYDAWYRQDFSRLPLRLRLGIINANEYFNVNDSAAMLMNSSFGIEAGLSANSPYSIYPKPGYGAMARIGVSDSKLVIGVFDGDPATRSTNFDDGQLSIAEWQQKLNESTEIKLGGWQCYCSLLNMPTQKGGTYGNYASIEHGFKDFNKNDVTLFARSAISHGANTQIPRSFSLGIYYPSLFKSRPDDEFTAGITQARLQNHREETTFELSYRWWINQHINVQPDVQFIQSPDGHLPDAWVLSFRFNYTHERHSKQLIQ